MRKLVSLIAAVVVSVGALTPVAQADDIFNGGRSSGGSSQLIPPGITGSELPEIDGSVDLTKPFRSHIRFSARITPPLSTSW